MTDATRTEVRRMNVGVMAGVLGTVIPTASNLLVAIWRFPTTSASGTQVVQFMTDHQAALRAVAVLDTMGVTLWMVFGGAVWLRLRRASESDTLATSLFGIAFAGMVILLMTGFTVFFVLIYRVPDPPTARVLYNLAFGLLAMSGMPAAVALWAYAATTFITKHLPPRTAQLAVVTAVAHVLLIGSLVVPRGIFSLEGVPITAAPALLFAWILTTALTLRRPDWLYPAT